MSEEPTAKVLFCPRCDRPYTGKRLIEAWNTLIDHVKKAHPDYDPKWHEVDEVPDVERVE